MSLIDQALHGYDGGHRELFRSAELRPEEGHQLELLSDLAGYPEGPDFRPYLTGYPLGRFYVVARTWPDLAAERSGTVWTHSLLIPRGDMGERRDLAALLPLHVRPSHPLHRARWTVPVQAPALASIPAEPPFEKARTHLVAAWFEETRRPFVWADGDSAEAALLWLWRLLPAEARANLTFCTGVMQARYQRDTLFAWQGIDERMLRYFGEPLRAARVVDPQRPAPALTIAAGLNGAEPETAQELWTRARQRGFDLSRVPATAILRYDRLRAESASASLLGCLDLLRAFGGCAEEAEEVLREWISLAPREGEPELLLDRVSEILVRDPAVLAPSVAEELVDWLDEALSSTALHTRPERARALYERAGSLRPSITRALLLGAHATDTGTITSLLEAFPELASVMLDRLDRGRRRQLAGRLVATERARGDSPSRTLLLQIAEARDDFELLAELAEPADLAPLDVLVRIHERAPDGRAAARILGLYPAEVVYEWSMGARVARLPLDGPLRPLVLDRLKEAPHLASRLGASEMTPHDSLALAAQWGFPALEVGLGDSAGQRVWRWLQEAKDGPVDLCREALDSLDSLALLQSTDPTSHSWAGAVWAPLARERVADAVIHLSLDSQSRGSMDEVWETSPLARVALASAPWRSFRKVGAAEVPAALSFLMGPICTDFRRNRGGGALKDLLTEFSVRPPPEPSASAEAWTNTLAVLPSDASASLATVLLERCLACPSRGAGTFAAHLFTIVHPILLEKERHGLIERAFEAIQRMADASEPWNKGKQLRKPFAAAWATAGWEPEVIYLAAGESTETFAWLLDAVVDQRASRMRLAELGSVRVEVNRRWFEWRELALRRSRGV